MGSVLGLHAMKWAGFGAEQRELRKIMFSGEKSYSGGKCFAVLLLATSYTRQQQYRFVGKFKELSPGSKEKQEWDFLITLCGNPGRLRLNQILPYLTLPFHFSSYFSWHGRNRMQAKLGQARNDSFESPVKAGQLHLKRAIAGWRCSGE